MYGEYLSSCNHCTYLSKQTLVSPLLRSSISNGSLLSIPQMDLTSVGDVDIASGKAGCCEPMREIATLSINGESNNEGVTFEFNVSPRVAEDLAEKIHNASVEATMHARALRVGAAATESTKK